MTNKCDCEIVWTGMSEAYLSRGKNCSTLTDQLREAAQAIQQFLNREISTGRLQELLPTMELDDTKYQQWLEDDANEFQEARAALTKISEIRDDIIGRQTINWSAHIYPLVKVLEEAGFKGIGYEEASSKAQTVDEELREARAELKSANTTASDAKLQNERLVQAVKEARAEIERLNRDIQVLESTSQDEMKEVLYSTLAAKDQEIERLTGEVKAAKYVSDVNDDENAKVIERLREASMALFSVINPERFNLIQESQKAPLTEAQTQRLALLQRTADQYVNAVAPLPDHTKLRAALDSEGRKRDFESMDRYIALENEEDEK